MYQGVYQVDVSMSSIKWKKTNLDYDSAIEICDQYLADDAFTNESEIKDRYIKTRIILNLARNHEAEFFGVDASKFKFIMAFVFYDKTAAKVFVNELASLSDDKNSVYATIIEKS